MKKVLSLVPIIALFLLVNMGYESAEPGPGWCWNCREYNSYITYQGEGCNWSTACKCEPCGMIPRYCEEGVCKNPSGVWVQCVFYGGDIY